MTKSAKIPGIAGVLLAGGRSSRFGTNKALALLDGKPLIEHVAETLSHLFSELLLVTNTPDTYQFLGWPMTGDIIKNSGPLAGIHAALHTVVAPRAFVIACDMPLVDERLVRYLCSLADDWDAVVPRLAKGLEPLCAVYHKNALPVITENLNRQQRKISKTFAQLRTRKVKKKEILAVTGDEKIFWNINRPDDLAAISRKTKKGELGRIRPAK